MIQSFGGGRRPPALWGAAIGVALAMLLAGAPAVAEERDALIAQGQKLFTEHGCHGCHTLNRMGTPIAPDLSRVGFRYDEAFLTRWLRDPEAQKPTAHMPKLDLSDADVQALAAFLSSRR